MIRILFMLLLTITIFIGFVLFPNIANQPVRIEILGWLLETRTGMFTLLVLLILATLSLLKKTLRASVNSPKQLWSSLRNGSKKRRELRLQEALSIWIDHGDGHSHKLINRSKGVVPDWLHHFLSLYLGGPSTALKINLEKDSPLTIATKARFATDPQHLQSLAANEQQQFLDAWLAAHPASPLALQRKAALSGTLHHYEEQVALLEELLQKNKNIHTLKPQLAQGLLHLSNTLSPDDLEHKLPHLRKAHRLAPEHTEILIALALALCESGDKKSGCRLLLDFLAHHDAMNVAQAALPIFSDEPLKNFKTIDKATFQNSTAGNWLRINLAHQANLTGLAEDGLHDLLAHKATPQLWQLRAQWYAEQKLWQQAAEAYQKAAELS